MTKDRPMELDRRQRGERVVAATGQEIESAGIGKMVVGHVTLKDV
jgi:hypothetical protein